MLYNLPNLQTKITYLLIYLLSHLLRFKNLSYAFTTSHVSCSRGFQASEQRRRLDNSYLPLCAIVATKIITTDVQEFKLSNVDRPISTQLHLTFTFVTAFTRNAESNPRAVEVALFSVRRC